MKDLIYKKVNLALYMVEGLAEGQNWNAHLPRVLLKV